MKILSRHEQTKMDSSEIYRNWNEHKGKLKVRFALLTENELICGEGKKEEILGKIQISLGTTKNEIHKIIDS